MFGSSTVSETKEKIEIMPDLQAAADSKVAEWKKAKTN